MTLAKFSSMLLLLHGVVLGQHVSHPVIASRDDAYSAPRSFLLAVDSINVLAVMVQFQPDNDTRTTGDGRFVVSAPTDAIVDAPPHNARYFRDHLTFLSNYYRKSSKGKVLLFPTLIDSVITLPNPMASYSPPKNGSNAAVGDLVSDTWRRVDSLGLVPDFSRYGTFVVFHAGAGRDVDLVATLGYDPTPSDIPSLYIGLNALRSFYGPSYEGIPVNGGAFHIQHTIVVPETENRSIPTVTGSTLLELGINGLLCASVGSYLGLPDLFDTKTGSSGIGRFGLMDGQSIFSFAGVFPPEPSAWEKYWLGWIEPLTVPPGEHVLSLPAVSLADSIYRVPISAGEYFLVENRSRDPLRNGQAVTSVYNGVERVQRFGRDTTGFNAFDISALSGVITDVEDLDWSLPGGIAANGTMLDGGILIWHVDESVIRQNLATNTVNADPLRRGIDLEEADGSQDIGQQYGFLAAGSGSEEGTALDFWYLGNGSPVYKNEFSPTSYPRSASYSGANSHVTIRSFSIQGPRMSATAILGDKSVSPLQGYPKALNEILPDNPLAIGSLSANAPPSIVVSTTGIPPARATPGAGSAPSPGKLYAWSAEGKASLAGGYTNGLIALATSSAPPVTTPSVFTGGVSFNELNGDGITELLLGQALSIGGTGTFRAITGRTFNPSDSVAGGLFSTAVGQSITAPPIAGDSIIALGTSNGKTYFYNFRGILVDSLNAPVSPPASVAGISRYTGSNAFIVTQSDGTVRITSRSTAGGTTRADIVRNFGKTIVGPAVAGIVGRSSAADPNIAFATGDGFLFLLEGGLNIVPGFPLNTGDVINEPPALADVDGDGIRDIVVFSGERICAYNFTGASLDNFPITPHTGNRLASAPVIADVDGDGNVEVVAATEDGLVVAYDRAGHMAPGFPLQAGVGHQSAGLFTTSSSSSGTFPVGLVVASSGDGSVSAWITGNPGTPALQPWPQYQKNAHHSGLALESLTTAPISSEFFPKSRAYNWPNPVYDGKTFIRYFVKNDASIQIKIFDLAGDLVTHFPGPGVGGVDNEVEWNVANVQSGIYFARIEAAGSGGNGVVIVKVAVVK
jgi:hypothetical protein